MTVRIDSIPNWKFEIEEISVSVYKLRGTRESAASIELTGTDPDNLLEAGKERALTIEKDLSKLQ